MSEKLYAIKESTMAAIAASLRDVAGTTEPINGDEISGYVTTTLPLAILASLDEVLEDQDDIIAQIQTALQGKAAGGSTEPVLQEKTVDPSTSTQTVIPDNGYDGLSQVTVNAIPTATQATPSITVSSAGLITASATQSAGYVTAGTKSATKQLTTQAAKTITPSTSSQTAVASGRYTTGAVTVAAIPSSYVQPTGTLSIAENGTYDVTNYASVNIEVESSSSGEGPGIPGGELGSVETCIVTLYSEAPTLGDETLYYTDGTSSVQSTLFPSFGSSASVTVMKNSIVASENGGGQAMGNITTLVSSGANKAFFVYGDCSITLM